MDKLPEPEFVQDKQWPRLLHGVNERKEECKLSYTKKFAVLSFLTSFRYLREITYYQKNYATTAIVVPLLILSSHFIAQSQDICPYVLAAERNNERELDFIAKYKHLYKEAKSHKIDLPDHLIF